MNAILVDANDAEGLSAKDKKGTKIKGRSDTDGNANQKKVNVVHTFLSQMFKMSWFCLETQNSFLCPLKGVLTMPVISNLVPICSQRSFTTSVFHSIS